MINAQGKIKGTALLALLRELGLIAPAEPLRPVKSMKDRDFNFSVFFTYNY